MSDIKKVPAGEVRISLRDYHLLLQEKDEATEAFHRAKEIYGERRDVMIEFLSYLKTSPYFKDIMSEFNSSSKRLTMYTDENKNVRIKINGEEA